MKKKTAYILLAIILIATTLRLYHLTYHDSYTDEAILAFRSVGLLDYDTSSSQTSVWQWFATVPWWAHLSMSDHPILFYLVQHFSIQLFGENLLAVRLPSASAGVGSVILLFFIGKKLFNERVGLLAAGLLAVQSYHIWVSRIGLQDGFVIFFLLLSVLFLLQVRKKSKYWLLLGATVGFGIINKYTTLIIFPIIFFYCIAYRLSPIRLKQFWYGILLLVVFFSPAWIYNLMLYRATGHFDFQISAALHQTVPQWEFRLGRSQVGGLSDRFVNFFMALYYSNSQLFNFAAIISLGVGLWRWWGTRSRELVFLLGATGIMYLWFFVIGSTYRFVVMIVPFLVLIISNALNDLIKHANCESFENAKVRNNVVNFRSFAFFAVRMFIIFELLFSVNTFFLSHTFGPVNITYAKVNEEEQNYGFNQLNQYLNNLLQGKVSGLFGQPAYKFLTEVQTKNIAAQKARGDKPLALIIIYDNDINFVAGLWYFQRLISYYGWPVMSDVSFMQYTAGKYDAYYRAQGVTDFVYIAPLNYAVLKPIFDRPDRVHELRQYLDQKNIKPEIIRNDVGVPAFEVYRF